MRCGCGIPNRADHLVHMVVGRDVPGGTETSEVYAYVCDEHLSAEPADALHEDIAREWEVLEVEVSRLRRSAGEGH